MPEGELTETRPEPSASGGANQSRPGIIYALMCFIGAALLDTFSYTGLLAVLGTLLISYGSMVLRCRSKAYLSYVIVAVVGAAGLFIDPVSGVNALVIGTITILLVRKLPVRISQTRLFTYSLLFAFVMFIIDAVTAYLAGSTFAGQISALTTTVTQQVTLSGRVPAESLTLLQDAVKTFASLWPAIYVIQGFACTVLVGEVGKLAFRRHGGDGGVPGISGFHLSIDTVSILVAGLACVALGNTGIAQASIIRVLGYNLIVCSAAVFALQGVAVASYFMLRAGWGVWTRAIMYVILLQVELMFLLPTLVGLVDLWADFRKLGQPVDGSSSEA